MKVFCINCEHHFYLYGEDLKCEKSKKLFTNYATGENGVLYEKCVYRNSGDCKDFELRINKHYKKDLFKFAKRLLKKNKAV
jgi:hypothetical protein